jgi:hypothetical protein
MLAEMRAAHPLFSDKRADGCMENGARVAFDVAGRISKLDTDGTMQVSGTQAAALTQSPIYIGANASVVGSGFPLTKTLSAAMRVYADCGAVHYEDGSAVRTAVFRNLLTLAQPHDASVFGAQNQIKIVATGDVTHVMGNRCGSWNYCEIAVSSGKTLTLQGAHKITGACFGMVSADGPGAVTISADHTLAAFGALSNVCSTVGGLGTFTETGKFCAFTARCNDNTYYRRFSIGMYLPATAVTQGLRIGDWVGAGAAGSALGFSTALNFYGDGQLDIVGCYGESTADLTNAYSAKVGRFRHVVGGSSLQVNHETYGLVGQLVGRSASLLHMHAGLMGTLEANTTALVCNGAYAYSVAAVIGRVGGGGLITATKAVAGVSAILNGAAMASGNCTAFAACATSTGDWSFGLSLANCDRAFDFVSGGCYDGHGVGTVSSTKQVLVNTPDGPMAMALFAVGT